MIKKLIEYYKGLKIRERIFLLLFITLVSAAVYYNFFYKPLTAKISVYKFQIEKLKSRLAEVDVQYPELNEKQKVIAGLALECDELGQEIEELESKLPSKVATSHLIGELTRLAQGLKLESIRQKVEEGKGDEYSKIFVEVKMDTSFTNIVDYVKHVETISPFIMIESLEILEPQRKKKAGTISTVVVSSILGEMPFAERLRAESISEIPAEFRDIFVSKMKPVAQKRDIKLKLEGLTYDKRGSTAIIDGEVRREGAQIEDLTVKKILPNKVVLTDGIEEYILRLER